ncbi:MAG: MtnX-like HAD-IB family phosphatase [Candidatus Heimdallarchaeaceae archaeon]|jgi:2,3-diketo-5-methylthio-1-phosphopentane phosphatase
MQIAICCDFDGTITLMDTGKLLLTKLTDKDWQYYDKLVINGDIGTREALIHQWGMIEETSMGEIFKYVDQIKIDPTFKQFFNWVKKEDFRFVIISDGFETYINRILENHSITSSNFDIKANDMHLENRKIILDFLTAECEHDCANCKYSQVKELKDQGYRIIYIGDGLSDIFPARNLADIIFAKENEDLAIELEGDSRLIVFTDFSDIQNHMKNL